MAASSSKARAKALLVLGRELRAAGGEIEDVDGHLAFRLDQGDLDVAILAGRIAS